MTLHKTIHKAIKNYTNAYNRTLKHTHTHTNGNGVEYSLVVYKKSICLQQQLQLQLQRQQLKRMTATAKKRLHLLHHWKLQRTHCVDRNDAAKMERQRRRRQP